MPQQAVLPEAQPIAEYLAARRARNAAKFQALTLEWQQQHAAMSSITEMASLPAYQKIIGLGEDAVPMILAQLKDEGAEPDQWFWALRALTDADPVPPEDRGNSMKMAQAWIAWGENLGYVR
jgi:hypothetical protein